MKAPTGLPKANLGPAKGESQHISSCPAQLISFSSRCFAEQLCANSGLRGRGYHVRVVYMYVVFFIDSFGIGYVDCHFSTHLLPLKHPHSSSNNSTSLTSPKAAQQYSPQSNPPHQTTQLPSPRPYPSSPHTPSSHSARGKQ